METLTNDLQEAPTKDDILRQIYQAVFDYLVASDATINVAEMQVTESAIASNQVEAPTINVVNVATPSRRRQRRSKTCPNQLRAWSPEDDAVLRVVYSLKTFTTKQIAKQLGRTVLAIRGRAAELSVTRR